MARELERIGVRVNAIAPVARTRLTEAVAGDFMNAKEGEFDRFAPENAAAVAVWLASPLAAGITGQVVKVQGGSAQLLQGWRPVDRGDRRRRRGRSTRSRRAATRCSAKADTGVPPFMPAVEG